MYSPYPLAIQTTYQDLLDRHRRRPPVSIEGSLIVETRRGQKYWTAKRRIGDRIRETHIGPDNADIRKKIERAKAEQEKFEAWKAETSSLVAQLRAAGANTLDIKTGKVIAALSRVGFFAGGGLLAGTHAFALYEMELGVKFQGVVMRTEDVDLLADRSVKIVADKESSMSTMLGDVGFKPVASLTDAFPSRWSFENGTPVDVLTPLQRGKEAVVPLKGLGIHAQALPFIEFLMVRPIEAVGLYREGMLVRVPAPERYAIHKLIVASERKGSFRSKSEKDLQQAATLIAVLSEQRPFELKDAYTKALERGPKWKKAIKQSLEKRPAIAERLSNS